MNNGKIIIKTLHSFQYDYMKKMKTHEYMTDQHELYKKSTFMIEIDLLMLEEIKKIH